jgi:hypothetical protein
MQHAAGKCNQLLNGTELSSVRMSVEGHRKNAWFAIKHNTCMQGQVCSKPSGLARPTTGRNRAHEFLQIRPPSPLLHCHLL